MQRVRDNDVGQVEAKAMLTELLADNRALTEAIREAKQLADDWIDASERRVWFLTKTVGPVDLVRLAHFNLKAQALGNAPHRRT